MENKLWYERPAAVFTDALPFGNGSFGGMVYGGIAEDKITLNQDTLWSGTGTRQERQIQKETLQRARELIFRGDYREADDFIRDHMLGFYNESYMPLGTLLLEYEGIDNTFTESYRRTLDLEQAVITTSFADRGRRIERQLFASFPQNAVFWKITCKGQGGISLRMYLDSKLRHKCMADGEAYWMEGEAPSHVEPNYVECPDAVLYEEGKKGIHFVCSVRLLHTDGRVSLDSGGIHIRDASEAEICIVCENGYQGYGKELESDFSILRGRVQKREESILESGFEKAKRLHIQDYSRLYKRTVLDLEEGAFSGYPTDVRLAKFREGEKDPAFSALYFNYGRYLLISSSRKGGQPANLQGLWNEELRPAWSSNYTLNINTQMNYWMAEESGLWECLEPYMDLDRDLSVQGTKTEREHFHCRGWAACHNNDLWRQTSPVAGEAKFAYWPMGGVWLCAQLYTHFMYSRDLEYLRECAYPLLRGAALFCLDWLVEGKDKKLHTCPSTSPENAFRDKKGRVCSATYSSALDISLIRELFEHMLYIREVLCLEDEIMERIEKALPRLPEYKTGADGCLQEWQEDYEETEKGHRHFSLLYGLYPGELITDSRNSELTEAAEKLLEKRTSNGSGQTGWSCAWLISLYARLGDGQNAYKYLEQLIRISPYLNLFAYHPPLGAGFEGESDVFQIDGNLGAPAGIMEMLLQSQGGVIRLLPALPDEWESGRVSGLCAQGNFRADITWEKGRLKEAVICSEAGSPLKLKYREHVMILDDAGRPADPCVLEKGTVPGSSYKVFVV